MEYSKWASSSLWGIYHKSIKSGRIGTSSVHSPKVSAEKNEEEVREFKKWS